MQKYNLAGMFSMTSTHHRVRREKGGGRVEIRAATLIVKVSFVLKQIGDDGARARAAFVKIIFLLGG